MVTLTQEMKNLFAKDLAYVATVDHDGNPDIGPKMSMQVMDDSHLMYYERTAGQTLRNLEDNGKLVVVIVDYPTKTGYRFHGPVTLHKDDEIHAAAIAYADEHGLKHPAVVPVMEITRIDNLAPGATAGKPIAGE